MLEGLEISIIKLSEILNDNEEFRIDSEYYRKEYLDLYKNFNKCILLEKIVYMSDLSTNGSFKTVSDIIHDNFPKIVPFIRSGNAGSTFINLSDLEYISKEAHLKLQKSKTDLYDVIMARKGKIGGASIILSEQIDYNCNENVIKLRILNKELINPFYFTVYFNSKFGIKQIERLSTGNVQPWVSIFQIRKLKLILLSNEFQTKIEKIVLASYELLTNSKSLYTAAENLLLTELGLHNWQPTQTNTNVVSFAESFLLTGRLDAEYYQPKYEELEKQLHKFDTIKLNKLVKFAITSGSTPKAGDDSFYTDNENGVPFVRAVDIRESRVNTDNFIYIKKEVHNGMLKKTQLEKNDVLFSIAGTVGRCGIFEHEFEANINQAIAILRFDETIVKRLYLIMFFNSYIGSLLIEKFARQGVQTNLNLDEVGNLYLPIIDKTIQNQISAQIQESFALKSASKKLLDLAKRAVEVAIEEGEAAGIQLLMIND